MSTNYYRKRLRNLPKSRHWPVLKKLSTTLLTICSISTFLSAQFNPTIRTGRPGQSIGPYTVGREVFQVQTGMGYKQGERVG